MAKVEKMNVVLAKVDHSASVYAKEVNEYAQFFTNAQGAFRGEKKTYIPREGYPDDPTKKGVTAVQTTVSEQLDWFKNIATNYLNEVFSVEATNSMGARKVELVVDGHSFGELTALDLMRLKSILTSKELVTMYERIPVYSDSEIWKPTNNAEYGNREILENELVKGVSRTTETTEEILRDPNIDPANIPANYRAAVVQRKKTVEIGDYTHQRFTGEWSQKQRADLLARRSKLLKAVIAALKEVNDQEAIEPNLDTNALIDYIHYGK